MTATMPTACFVSKTGLTKHIDFVNYGCPNIAVAEASINYIGLRNLRASPQVARDTNTCFQRWLDFLPERQATARYLIGAAVALGFASGTTIVSAEVKTVPDRQTRQAYEACLSSEATKGTYTASDGGISALRLMEQCKLQLDEWRRDCTATGYTVNRCNLLAASYAQAVLELLKPPSKP